MVKVSIQIISQKIYLIRGYQVMLDSDLAQLYEVGTGALNRAVRRNCDRFPMDFMFQLTQKEFEFLRCQIGISEKNKGGRRYLPYVFTEQGVAMLSCVLKSKRAVNVNIEIMRTFVKLRELLLSNKDLARKLNELEMRYDEQFKVVFDAIRQIMSSQIPSNKRKIGFH